MKRIVLHVDRMSLRGFGNRQGRAIAESLRGELARQLRADGAGAQLVLRGSVERLQIPDVRVSGRAQPRGIGALAARGIARGLKS